MRNAQVQKLNNLIAILLMLATCMMMLIGCDSKEPSEKDIGGIVEQKLLDKYNENFTCEAVADEGIDASQGQCWCVTLKDNDGKRMKAWYYPSSDKIEDTYSELLFKDMLYDEVRKLLDGKDYIHYYTIDSQFSGTEYNWMDATEYDFKATGDYLIELEIELNAEDEQSAVDQAFYIVNGLQDENIRANVGFYIEGIDVIIDLSEGEEVTKETVEKAIDEADIFVNE